MKRKARLVAREFSQVHTNNFMEKLARVPQRQCELRLWRLLALSVIGTYES